jgi:mxaJ protein
MSLPFPRKLFAWFLLALAVSACGRKQTQSVASVAAAQPTITRSPGVLRVCADPNNLPFSNQRLEGFENKIAELIGNELGEKVEYTWWAQRRGFIRNTLKAGSCDVVMGLPTGFEMTLTTVPYYRSSYVFLSRRDRHLNVTSFDDPRLKQLNIGVQIIGDDFSNTPPAHALTNRHIVGNVKGYTVYGDYARPNPPARIVDAVSDKDVDLAIVWGPLAGYFAKHQRVPMEITPVSPQIDAPFLPFVYDISMGVRRDDHQLHDQLDQILERKQQEINRILDEYGVPRVNSTNRGAQPS